MPARLDVVTKAVIPLAGLGIRFFPASQAVKKEWMPVVGADGIARPMLAYHLLELVAAGIEQICLIVQPGDDHLIRDTFSKPAPEVLRRLDAYPALAEEARRLPDFRERVQIVLQHEPAGYGHAVFQSRAFANGEMVLLCLGDHLFRGAPVSPYRECAAQAAHSGGRTVSAVNRIGPAQLKSYGTIAGQRRPENPRLIDVEQIVEKPAIDLARRELRVNGLGPDEFLGWFGLHLLGPSIYDVLAQMIRDNVRDKGEVQLTRAQDIQREREGYLAWEMTAAERFDFGTPDDYLDSLMRFRGDPDVSRN
ncbi:MAG: sugar phosphate nucleotidyltransferase [Kiritimatiellae bacterium]|nr:sugar phosphate nucleotidyltransferase [Kiritimatiellia bacterium]MDD4341804.1 sugar phosphate nucleotidyltransferase [Kiritimatiellia bacterium]